jgi:PiT family inorganic phosphate transporter
MDLVLLGVIAVIALALLFDFTNGFHDAANSVATAVATRALPARLAPAFAAVFNFLAFFVVGTAVADTIAKVVMPGTQSIAVAFAAVFAAVLWNFLTWHWGLPSSSGNALIGGLIGAGFAAGGLDGITWSSVWHAAVAILVSPAVAFLIAIVAMRVIFVFQCATRLPDDSRVFKGLQLVSAAGVAFGHGANDAQKTMGVITALLLGAGYTRVMPDGMLEMPMWVGLASYSAIALGTLWGGWRIIQTVGLRITRLHSNSAVAASIGAISAVFGATSLGIPASSTSATVMSIAGAGVSSGEGTRWRAIRTMAICWVVTMPAAAVIGFTVHTLTQLPTALAWLAVSAVLVISACWILWAVRHAVHASDVEAEIPSESELAEPLLDQD